MVKNLPANAGDVGLIPGSERSPWRRAWQPTPVFLPGESHGLAEELDRTEEVPSTMPSALYKHIKSNSHQSY